MGLHIDNAVKWEETQDFRAKNQNARDASCDKCRISYLWNGKPGLVDCPNCGRIISSGGKGMRRAYRWVTDVKPVAVKVVEVASKAHTKKADPKKADSRERSSSHPAAAKASAAETAPKSSREKLRLWFGRPRK